LRPVWSLAALGLALSLLVMPMAARADDDDDDNGATSRQGTVRIYGGNDDAQGGYLGVQVQDVTRALQRARNLPTDEGALVNRVEDESPADHAGVRRGDVITEVDKEKIDGSQDLIRVVGGLEPGSRVRVTLWRSGSVRTVTVQLGERPHGMTGMPNFKMPSGDDHPMLPPTMSDRDVQRQIQELRDQLQELRQEIQSLRRELRSNDRDRDDNDRSRKNDDEDDD
jgi:hypothetical protein